VIGAPLLQRKWRFFSSGRNSRDQGHWWIFAPRTVAGSQSDFAFFLQGLKKWSVLR
jgi:hypothetical protein